jgi:type II secretory pathway pseudopilin PulG
VIVIVIIGIIAAIAVPRMSRGAEGATDAALKADLATLRSAIDLFTTEHPGVLPSAGGIVLQLTGYSDINGVAQATKDASHIYGPYIRAIPPAPVGPRKGQNGIAAADAATIGWIYDSGTGAIRVNTTTETDAAGALYSSY